MSFDLDGVSASKIAGLRRKWGQRTQADAEQAILGDENGRISVDNERHYYYVRFANGTDADSTTQYGRAFPVLSGAGYFGSEQVGTAVYIGIAYDGKLAILGTDRTELVEKGLSPRAENPSSPYRQFKYMRDADVFLAQPLGTQTTQVLEVRVEPGPYVDDNGVVQLFAGGKIDLSGDVPAADADSNSQHLIVGVFINTSNALESFTSTAKLIDVTLTWDTDVAEVFTNRSARALPVRYYVLSTSQTLLSKSDEFNGGDGRQWITAPKRKNNFIATTDPGVNDDIDDGSGYEVGSIWLNTTNDQLHVCTDSTSGAAVWREVGLDSNHNFHGSFIETIDFTIASDGATITASLEQDGGGDLQMFFSDGITALDCTPACTIALTAGTATTPQENFIYILQSTKVLTKSTSDWPTTEHIKVANCHVRTEAITQTDGALGNRNWNDHWQDSINMGHILHIAQRMRQNHAEYDSGISPTVTIVGASSPDDVTIATTAGTTYQLHRQNFPLFDMAQYTIDAVSTVSKTYTISDDGDLSAIFPDGKMIGVHDSTGNDGTYTIASTNYSAPDFVITVSETIASAVADGTIGDDIHIVNRNGAAYTTVTDLNGETSDSAGVSLSNKHFSFVLWGVQNRSGTISHLMLNLPSGSYNSSASAIADTLNYSDFNIPAIFKGLGFLISRFTFQHSSAGSGTWTLSDTEDLRGKTPNTTAGAGGGGTGVTDFLGLSDTPSAYTSQATFVPIVNAAETALEFTPFIKPHIPQARISVSSTLSVPSSDVTGTTIYVLPHGGGDKVTIYDGTNWIEFTIPSGGINITNAGLAVDTNYDLYIYDSSGATIELVAWTNDTTRATALAQQDEYDVKSGDDTRFYMGAIRTYDGGGGTVTFADVGTGGGGSIAAPARRFVSNRYNRLPRDIDIQDDTNSTTTSTTSIEAWHQDTNNRADIVNCVDDEPVVLHFSAGASSSGTAFTFFNIGLAATTKHAKSKSGFGAGSALATAGTAVFEAQVGIGKRSLYLNQVNSAATSNTIFGDNGTPTILQFGAAGHVWG